MTTAMIKAALQELADQERELEAELTRVRAARTALEQLRGRSAATPPRPTTSRKGRPRRGRPTAPPVTPADGQLKGKALKALASGPMKPKAFYAALGIQPKVGKPLVDQLVDGGKVTETTGPSGRRTSIQLAA